ncbi:MAG: prolipoprotein diacylglyceryl transferase [bacterium]
MFPELFRIGDIAVHTYGLMIAIGIILAMIVVKKECRRIGIDGDKVVDTLFWGIWAGIIGSRILYVLYFPEEFRNNFVEVFKVWKGGLVFHGGIIAAVPVVIYLLRKHKIEVIKATDAVALGIPLAHFFGRLGCFSAGCCYGEVCELPWAVRFTHPLTIAPKNIPLHPTQLYEAFLNLALFIILFVLRKRVKKSGGILGIYLIGYGSIRFFVELFRGDPRGIYMNLSSAQWISIAFIVGGIFFLIRKK